MISMEIKKRKKKKRKRSKSEDFTGIIPLDGMCTKKVLIECTTQNRLYGTLHPSLPLKKPYPVLSFSHFPLFSFLHNLTLPNPLSPSSVALGPTKGHGFVFFFVIDMYQQD